MSIVFYFVKCFDDSDINVSFSRSHRSHIIIMECFDDSDIYAVYAYWCAIYFIDTVVYSNFAGIFLQTNFLLFRGLVNLRKNNF